jgi:hypothetical protein
MRSSFLFNWLICQPLGSWPKEESLSGVSVQVIQPPHRNIQTSANRASQQFSTRPKNAFTARKNILISRPLFRLQANPPLAPIRF